MRASEILHVKSVASGTRHERPLSRGIDPEHLDCLMAASRGCGGGEKNAGWQAYSVLMIGAKVLAWDTLQSAESINGNVLMLYTLRGHVPPI